MPKKEIAGVSVDVNEEGYLTDSSQWNREIAIAIAKCEGIAILNDFHWQVIEFLQKDFEEKGTLPTIRRINKTGGISTKELYEYFPDGPLKKASKIAGLPKPQSCV
jgi:tRNA 2-thiouridine synthesizing protein E